MPVVTLLMRFSAPLQSWGDFSRFSHRNTQRQPTKSGVVGLVAAALGRRRTDPIEDIVALSYGVRIDQAGELLRDFHTARNEKQSFVSHRYYLADARFLVGLCGEEAFLREIEHAIQHPIFPLFLGRRSCPPEGTLSLGLREMSLLEALGSEPWLGSGAVPPSELEIVYDDTSGVLTSDHPISFSQVHRTYGLRYATHIQVPLPQTSHDAMAMLEEG